MTANVAPTHHDIRLPDGRRHHYVSIGAGGPRARPAARLHQFLAQFRIAVRYAVRQISTLRPGSTRPWRQRGADSYAIPDFAADAIAFIESLGGEPVHLVGHSLGTIVAQRIAQTRPDLLASLILIGAAPSTGGHAGLQEMRGDLAGFADHVPRDYVTGFQASTAHQPLAPAQLAIFVDESMKLGLDAWRRTVDGLLADAALATPITVPTLSIWGARDGVFDAKAQEALARKIPHLVAAHHENVGHAPHWETPARVAKDIENFILALPARQ